MRFRNSTRQQTSQTFDTKREADRFCHPLHALGPEAARDELSCSDDEEKALTLDAWAGRYLDRLIGVTPGTRIRYEAHLPQQVAGAVRLLAVDQHRA